MVQGSCQLIRHRQVGRVIGVELNDFVASILGNHPTLQRRRDSTILRAKHEISPDSCEGSGGVWKLVYRTARAVARTAVRSPKPRRHPYSTRITRHATPHPAGWRREGFPRL